MYGPDGSLLGNYRKSFLFPTDRTWASEPAQKQPPQRGDFFIKEMPEPLKAKLALGICMDINPYKFTAPVEAMEFATHVCASKAVIAVVSLAWSSVTLHAEDIEGDEGDEPDLQTLAYWVGRFKPVIQGSQSVVLVMANRCGVEGDACYVGSSLVARIGCGKVEVWEVLGQGVTGAVIVDTDNPTKYIWQEEPPLLNLY
jgi:protein N-terminal amidase